MLLPGEAQRLLLKRYKEIEQLLMDLADVSNRLGSGVADGEVKIALQQVRDGLYSARHGLALSIGLCTTRIR